MVTILIRFERFTVFQASGSAGGHDFNNVDYNYQNGGKHPEMGPHEKMDHDLLFPRNKST